MSTRYSAILPLRTTTFCPLIQAPSMFWSVLWARWIPRAMASSKPTVEDDVISVTLATGMVRPPSLPGGRRAGGRSRGCWRAHVEGFHGIEDLVLGRFPLAGRVGQIACLEGVGGFAPALRRPGET